MTNLPLSFRLVFSIFILGNRSWPNPLTFIYCKYFQWNRFVMHSVMMTVMIIRKGRDTKAGEGLPSPKLWLMIERIWSTTVTFDKKAILTTEPGHPFHPMIPICEPWYNCVVLMERVFVLFVQHQTEFPEKHVLHEAFCLKPFFVVPSNNLLPVVCYIPSGLAQQLPGVL